MYRIFPRVYFFVLCINIGVFLLNSALTGTQLESPFDSLTTINVTESDFPNIINTTDSTGTLIGNLTNPTNATALTGESGSELPFFALPDYFEIPFVALFYMIQFLSGGWIFSGIAIFGFSAEMLLGFQVLIGFWAVYTLVYYILGRG